MDDDLSRAMSDLRARQEPFAFATIVRTAGSTAARPGAKALLGADGTILHGWLGGGCTVGAVRKAAVEAFRTGGPTLVSVAPEDLLAEQGVAAGDEVDGKRFARNGCPSKGSVDIFIEPCVPLPQLVIWGVSPVAQALADLAERFQWDLTPIDPEDSLAPAAAGQRRFAVVATQGKGDLAALRSALASGAEHVSFVASRKKFAALAVKLRDAGLSDPAIDAVQAPAGLDIGAVTPEEIALSLLAELTALRRARSKG
ncbi:MAG: XdhC family protein [Pseudomonadota bacterium]